MEILRKGKWGDRSYGCWCFPSSGWGLDETDVSPHKKVSLWVRLAQGETLTRGEVESLVFDLSHQLFPQGKGWDLRELDLELGKEWMQSTCDYTDPGTPVAAVTLYMGKTTESTEYSPEEQERFRQAVRQIAEVVFARVK